MEQLPETLWIVQEVYRLYTAPLSHWLRDRTDVAFEKRTDACARGYIGRWEVKDAGLWLIDLHGWVDGRLTRVPDLFDGRQEVAADWYTGEILFEPAPDTLKEGAAAQMQRVYLTNGLLTDARPGPI